MKIFINKVDLDNSILLLLFLFMTCSSSAQSVDITSHSVNQNGVLELKVSSTPNDYFILQIRHDLDSTLSYTSSITLGSNDTTVITERLAAMPIENYELYKYDVQSPADSDDDGIDDITELNEIPIRSPLHSADPINLTDGVAIIDSLSTFKRLSLTEDVVQWSEFLNGKAYTKFIILDFYTSHPKIYFINTKIHRLHADFAMAVGLTYNLEDIKKGQIIYHPTVVSQNGTLGTYTFNYSNGRSQNFDVVERTQELLAANMLPVKNNLSYFVTENSVVNYQVDKAKFDSSRVSILLESDLFKDVDYWGLNNTEGYGYFREIGFGEVPNTTDIGLYSELPNNLSRVSGIITSVIQTPLSHVNLRAIQNNIPNAYLRNPLEIDSVAALLNHYIYLQTRQDGFTMREASADEVNTWFENIRPKNQQIPPLNLKHTQILPLDNITFSMYDGYGAKCTNVATMRTFDLPEGTIPDGFGIPFYYYQEFMRYNDFFREIDRILNDSTFQSSRIAREEILSDLRKKIRKAPIPILMNNHLNEMHSSFPRSTSIRCRSSSNNEDLPGFSGAGLYTSKTHHPHEGEISKTIKQVYASLWELRAFEEREFHRIDHFKASMGVLCHPNYSDEKVNGVGISIDPIYETKNTFYLNSQLGEELITNPGTNLIPEEILLDNLRDSIISYSVVRRSNLTPSDKLLMTEDYLQQMNQYLNTIHNGFKVLYGAKNNDSFAIDIEYKITKDNILSIKQARPWVHFQWNRPLPITPIVVDFIIFPNPSNSNFIIYCDSCKLNAVRICNSQGQIKFEKTLEENDNFPLRIENLDWSPGIYYVTVTANGTDVSTKKIMVY